MNERALEQVTVAHLRQRSRWGGLATLLLALLGFVLGSTLLRALQPDELRMGAARRSKFLYWRERADEFDLAFFGSSYVHCGIVPDVVDARLAEAGHPLRSFNFGLAAGFSFETDALLRAVVAQAGTRLRYLVIELPDWVPEATNLGTLRAAAWHDARQTWNVLAAMRGNLPLAEQLRLGSAHVGLFATQASSAGFGPDVVRAWLERGAERADVLGELDATRGFRARDLDPEVMRKTLQLAARIEDPGGGQAGGRGQLRQDARARRGPGRQRSAVEEYLATVAELRAGAGPERGPRRYPLELLRSQVAFLRAHGLEVVYLVAPVLYRTPWVADVLRAGVVPHLVVFNDPVRYPELFELELRLDENHLNQAGAQVFSRRLADTLVALLDQGRLEAR